MKKTLLLLCGAYLLVSALAYARQNKQPEPDSQKALSRIAGEYSRGYWYAGLALTLKADGSYSSRSHSDVIDDSDPNGEKRRDRGEFKVVDDKVILTSAKNAKRNAAYYIVPWGKRTYLISNEKYGGFEEFAKAIRQGKEPCSPIQNNGFLVRGKDSDGVPKGLPAFPKERRPLLQGVKPVDTDLPPGDDYIERLRLAANKASKEKDDKRAVKYAKDMLLRNAGAEWWQDYRHDAHVILGMAAFRKGNASAAKESLRKAIAAERLPWQSDCPYKELLGGLLAKGERKAVLDYVKALASSRSEPQKTKNWEREVMAGKIPTLFEPEEKR